MKIGPLPSDFGSLRCGVMEANVNYLDSNTNRRRRREAMHFFTVAEVAECVRVSTRTVRRWIKSGALPVHLIEGIVRVSGGEHQASPIKDLYRPTTQKGEPPTITRSMVASAAEL